MSPTILGVIGPGFLNQAPALVSVAFSSSAFGKGSCKVCRARRAQVFKLAIVCPWVNLGDARTPQV